MIIIHSRLLALQTIPAAFSPLIRSETLALHVRKIVEGIAFAALSVVEYRNGQVLATQRTKNADTILRWLAAKGLLRLPEAQTLQLSPTPEFAMILEGAADRNMSSKELEHAYSLASTLIHERHPERLARERVEQEMSDLARYAQRLHGWLWAHCMFFHGEAFLIQMGQAGTSSFFVPITQESIADSANI